MRGNSGFISGNIGLGFSPSYKSVYKCEGSDWLVREVSGTLAVHSRSVSKGCAHLPSQQCRNNMVAPMHEVCSASNAEGIMLGNVAGHCL